jgi:hypothetical protein
MFSTRMCFYCLCRVVTGDTLVWLVDCDSLYSLEQEALATSAIWGSDPSVPNNISNYYAHGYHTIYNLQ